MAIGLALFVEQLDLEHSVGHSLADDAFYFDDIFFRPVSYTHLDVYKRQVFWSAMRLPW